MLLNGRKKRWEAVYVVVYLHHHALFYSLSRSLSRSLSLYHSLVLHTAALIYLKYKHVLPAWEKRETVNVVNLAH